MLDEQFEELRPKLPAPTALGLEVLRMTDREDPALNEVAAVLQGDAALTRRLIELANSGATEGRAEVTTAQAAAVRLGLRSVRSSTLGFSLLAAHRSGNCPAFDCEGFWSHSLAVAAAAQTLARLRGDVVPNEAFACGLLQGIGRLALANVHAAAYEGVLERARGHSAARLAEIEQVNFGLDHGELAGAMLRAWRVPEPFCAAIAHVDGGKNERPLDPAAEPMACTLRDARHLARALTADIDASPELCRRIQEGLELTQARMHFDESALWDAWQTAAAAWSAWGEVTNLRGKPALGIADIRRRARKALATYDEGDAGSSVLDTQSRITGLRILLVGSEIARDSALNQALVDDGHFVTAVTEGSGAAEKAASWSAHMVVCDWRAGEASGPQVLRALRGSKGGDRHRCVMALPHAKESRSLEAFEAGADECVLRPCDPRIVVVHARAALRGFQLEERVRALELDRELQIGRTAVLARKLHLATATDALTGVYNRGFAVERLERAVEVSRNGTTALSVILFDIDRFQAINRTYGQDAGDSILRSTGTLTAGLLRKGDAMCRVGADEFLAICPGAQLQGGIEVAERLRVAIAQNVLRVDGFDRAVTASLAVAQLDDSHADVGALWRCVDRRLELARDAGGDRVVSADPPNLLRPAI